MKTAELQSLMAENSRLIGELRESQKELKESQKETDRQMKETDRKMQETDRQMKETDRQMKRTDVKIKGLADLFTGQWGKLVEALVDSGLPKLFRGRGIAVREVSRRHEIFEGSKKIAEIDVLLHNGGEDVAVEVKTTLRIRDVKEHLERLQKVRASVPSYSTGGKKLYGAVAALKFDAEADLFAERQGFFVLKSSDGLFEITNESGFSPQEK